MREKVWTNCSIFVEKCPSYFRGRGYVEYPEVRFDGVKVEWRGGQYLYLSGDDASIPSKKMIGSYGFSVFRSDGMKLFFDGPLKNV